MALLDLQSMESEDLGTTAHESTVSLLSCVSQVSVLLCI
ncbi:SapB/AmfS family lanthipeptide [Streptomyces orinoci]|uniref:SapB/AmfS family lanthipeptide n=1 Tax=Streptomyces orinoci TaxID=67339 RepID=A0ABV3JWL4_STRON|nr:SapB/AmfS family lanthipeptide [Streptomyces orinoci]